jgi:hypothetical protein
MFQPVCGALDRLGRLWVTDYGNSNVKIFAPTDLATEGFDPDADYLAVIGSKGTGNGQFNFSENSYAFPGIAIIQEGGQVESGEVIATQTVEGVETEFEGTLLHTPVVESSVTFTATVGGASVSITDDGLGALSGTDVTGTLDYVTGAWTLVFETAPDIDENITCTYQYDTDTQVTDEVVATQDVTGLESEFSGILDNVNINPGSLTISCNVDGSAVSITDTEGEDGLTGTLSDGGTITGTIDYVTGRWTLDFGETPPDSEVDGSADITAAYTHYGGDRVFVADTFNHRVQIFDITGAYKGQFGSNGDGDGEFKFPAGLAVDSVNYKLHVVDSGNNRVQILTPGVFWNSLTYTAEYGSFGHDVGNLYMPLGILFVDSTPDYTLVADSCNSRIVKFNVASGGASATAPAALADYVMKSLAWDNGMLTGVTSAGATGPAVYAPRSITSDGTNAMVTGFYVGNIQEWPLANWTLFGDQVFGKQTISQHERILMMAPQAVLHQSAADIALEGNPSAVVNEDGTPNTTGFFVITPGD